MRCSIVRCGGLHTGGQQSDNPVYVKVTNTTKQNGNVKIIDVYTFLQASSIIKPKALNGELIFGLEYQNLNHLWKTNETETIQLTP